MALAEPLFSDPMVAHHSKIGVLRAPKPCHHHDNRASDGDGQKNPDDVHERCPAACVAIAGDPVHKGTMTGGTRLITASNNAFGLGDVAATMSASRVSDIALAAIYKRKWRGDMQAPPFARLEKAR
jgi:hypothetical protein